MDVLRNIEKKLLTILSDKDKIDISKINSLKEDIRLYNEDINKKIQLLNDKKNKYIEQYHNKRLINEERYEKYIAAKENLMEELKRNKSKLALNNYLNEQFKYPHVVPDIYTYENISLKEERPIRDPSMPLAKPPAKPHAKPPAKPLAKPPAKPKVNEVKPEKECPEGKEINPVTKRCVKICDKDKIRNPVTGKCEKIKAVKAEKAVKAVKECPEGKEINPLTNRCVKICDKDKIRNPLTGKCEKIKK